MSAEPHLQPAWRAQITGWLVMDWSREILKAYLEKRWQALFTAGATRDDMVRSGGTKPLPCCREVRS